MAKVRAFAASVSYHDKLGKSQEDDFPVLARDHSSAYSMALAYVLQIMKLEEFELRVVGA